MENTLNSLSRTLEQSFGFSGELEKLTGGLSHEVYTLNTDEIIIKVYSQNLANERLQAEEQALQYLSKNNLVQTPQLILSLSGEYRVAFNSTYLSCFRKIKGERKYLLTECPADLSSINKIGQYLGFLHFEMSSCRTTIKSVKSPILEIAKIIPEVDLSTVQESLKKLAHSDAPYFLTHGDFQQSNLLYLGEQISGVIDFEYSGFDYRINDLAGCLSNLLSANSNKIPVKELLEVFIQGYEKTFGQKLLPTETDLLPTLLGIIWRVNLFWIETKLREVNSINNAGLLELYRDQTCRLIINPTIDL